MNKPLIFPEKRFVIYGRLSVKNRDIIAKLELAGARCCDKFNTRTDYIVIADSCSLEQREKWIDQIVPFQRAGKCTLVREEDLLLSLGLPV